MSKQEKKAVENLVAKIRVMLDQVDYTNNACDCTEMVGAVLSKEVIASVKLAIATVEEL